MSKNSVSTSSEMESESTYLTEVTSYLNNSLKQEKNSDLDENIQSFSQNLETNLVQSSDDFAENNTVSLNNTEVVESTSMILSQDDRMMYISAEGTVVFNPKEMASSSTEHVPVTLNPRESSAACLEDASNLNPNYLVVVENAGPTQPLSSDFSTPLVMNSETCEPDTNSSLASACAGVDNLKSVDSQHTHQQTIMVLDGQLQSDSILIDPSVLVAYDNSSGERISFSTDPSIEGANRSLPELCQGSYIHLEQAPLADGIVGYSHESILQKPTLSHNFHSTPTIVVAQNPVPAVKDSKTKGSDLEENVTCTVEEKEINVGGLADAKLLQHKEELRMLEKSHLKHHIKEAKKKLCNQTTDETSQTSINYNKRDELISSQNVDHNLPSTSILNEDADIETPVFSHITAKINADLLAHIPGCQRFLLQKMEQSPLNSQIQLSFESDSDCTFSGSLKSFIDVHNSLKNLLDVEDVSLLDLKMSRTSKETCDRGVMCCLLQPFISSRGRQPKYSYKAKAMGFTSDFESLLKIDDEEHYEEEIPITSSRNTKRKRGRPRKLFKMEGKFQSKENLCSPNIIKKKLSHEDRTTGPEAENQTASNIKTNSLPDLKDPLQQKLREEQLIYKKSQRSKTKEVASQQIGCNPALTQGSSDECGSQSHAEQNKSGDTEQLQLNEENSDGHFFCSHCSFKSKRQSQFLIHMRCHKDTTEKTFHCKKCDFVSSSLSYLKKHEVKHKESLLRLEDSRNKMIYSCPECKRTLRSKMHLHRHMRDVHGPDNRPYLCDNCGKAFKRTDALKQHKALHESKANRILPHKCTTCGKAFRSLAHLKEHLVIHTSERPYLCQYCGAAFKTQAVQKRHILTLHIKPRAHVCSVCCRQFNTKHALQRHENTHIKPENTRDPAVVVVGAMEEAHDTFDEKEKRIAISNIEAHVTGITVVMKDENDGNSHISVGGQASNTLVQDMIETTSAQTAIEDQIGSENERLQQAYIQDNQDATTLYYFTGDLNSL